MQRSKVLNPRLRYLTNGTNTMHLRIPLIGTSRVSIKYFCILSATDLPICNFALGCSGFGPEQNFLIVHSTRVEIKAFRAKFSSHNDTIASSPASSFFFPRQATCRDFLLKMLEILLPSQTYQWTFTVFPVSGPAVPDMPLW